jgi:hypothetical protein
MRTDRIILYRIKRRNGIPAQRIMWPGGIKQDLGTYAKSTGQMVVDRNNMTDGIIQDQQNMQVLQNQLDRWGKT